MSEWDWLNLDLGSGEGYGTVMAPGWGDAFGGAGPEYTNFSGMGGSEDFLSWNDPYGPGSSGDPSLTGEGSGNWWNTILGALGSVGGFLGQHAGVLGPLVSGAGSLAGGAIGSNASADAARQQAAALNRGMELQTAQWLQQQANQAPWLQAGQQALPQLQQLAGQGPQAAFQPPPSISGAGYALPQIAPTWSPMAYAGPQRPGGGDMSGMMTHGMTGDPATGTGGGGLWGVPNPDAYRYTPGAVPQASQYGYQGPQAVQAGDYRWTPGQGPRAQDYRYTPGQTPDAAQYRYTPGSAPRAADYRYTPGAVPTLSGQELLANDPGVAFRLQEGRNAMEASAAARGGALSGPALAALQRQGQELSSQEYGNAFERASQQAQMREGWNQYATQQGFGQAAQEAQMREQWGQQATAQNFGQAMSAAQLREQLQHVATQQGWSQAQTEAAFREQMAQQASQQGFSQVLGAQGQQWQQGMAGQQFDWSRAMGETGVREHLAQQAGSQNWQQALQGQQTAWQQGLTGQQWEQQQRQAYDQSVYDRMMQQSQTQYGRDTAQNATDYERMLAQYNSQLQNQQTQWNRLAGLANIGQTSVGQLGTQGANYAQQQASLLGQLGNAQGLGALGPALSWQRALGGATNNATSLLASLNR